MLQSIIDSGGPVILLVLLGYALAWRGFLDDKTLHAMTRLAMWVLIPATLVSLLTQVHLLDIFDLGIWGAFYGAVAVATVVLVLVLRLYFKCALPETAVLVVAGTFSNIVLLGIPIIEGSYGQPGLAILLVIVSIHAAALLTTAVLMAEWGLSGGSGWAAVGKTLVGVTKNPIIVALIVGIAISVSGWDLPFVISDALARLRGAVTPIALMVVGGGLWGVTIKGDVRMSVLLSASKSLALPALVYALGRWVFELPPFTVAVSTVVAAMPTGTNAAILAGAYNIGQRRVSSTILISTAISLIVAPLLIALLPRQ